MAPSDSLSPGSWHHIPKFLSIVALLALIPLQDTSRANPQIIYVHAEQLFLHGDIEKSQTEAELGYWRFSKSDPEWAAKFHLLEAESMVWRGKSDEALRILSSLPAPKSPEEQVERLTLSSVALTHIRRFADVDQALSEANSLCARSMCLGCGGVLRAEGILAMEHGQFEEARQHFLASLSFARARNDRWLEANALLNLGTASIQEEHFDEAVDWSRAAYRAGMNVGNENRAQVALGNLGWAYFKLGDTDRALEFTLDAGQHAKKVGNFGTELKWESNAGYVYQTQGDLTHAADSYRKALDLAKEINSKGDIVNSLEDLADASIGEGNLAAAAAYNSQAAILTTADGNRLDRLEVQFTLGRIASARRADQEAERIFYAVQQDPASQISMRMGAGHELAKLYEIQGNIVAADRAYDSALATFESARNDIKNEDSKLPFLANATGIYEDYIHLLVQQGKSDEALQLADQSRARTLAQALAVDNGKTSSRPAALNPRQIAQKTGATLLFYWLGQKQSYLWVVTPAKVTLFPLAPQREIADHVQRYSKFLLNEHDAVRSANEDGKALYQLLVAPAAPLIRPDVRVMILADGELSKLNFETLLVPGRSSAASKNSDANAARDATPDFHYMLEDATILSAPSLAMLAAAKPIRDLDRSLLLFGNPVSASDDYPSLPLFGFEMTRIEKHFAAQHVAAFSGMQATPASYLASNPSKYSYIHFVSHAVASRTDPLDSAIILSDSKAGEDSFKLYARDIMQHPIGARLVTISACYGSGTRSYAGEGLVGLSWAFLRAGAHSVIGALWEVSDDSTPRLMDKLYAGLEAGQSPGMALRNAKLELLHSDSRFRVPFYWAPFQIYTVQ